MKPCLLAILIPAFGLAQSAWLPDPGHVVLTATYTNQSFQDIWRGSKPSRLTAPVRQQTVTVMTEWGITSRLAADVTVGFTTNRSKAFGGPRSDTGMTDSRLGLRWKLLDEQRSDSRFLPTLSLRAAGIVQGTYQSGVAFSAGDGASGAETSILLGKAFGRTRFGSFADLGIRARNQRVPPDLFGTAGLYRSLGPMTFTVSYQHTKGLSGPDLGDRGFTFPRLREIVRTIETGVGFTRGRGKSLHFFTATSVGGRNTGDTFIVGMSGSLHIVRR